MKIGLCGTGKMGAAIAARLIDVGHEVTVWNRDAAKTAPLAAAGAKVAASPAALASECELVISMLLNAAALDSVYRGKDGILAVPLAGKLMMDMSTVLPETEQALAAEVAARGGAFIECPVGGTVAPARNGQLLGLAGGAAADVARAMPVLEQLCRRVEHVGPVGAGATMKLAINLPLLVYWQALGEALSLCRGLGLPAERLISIMADTSGAANAIKLRGPDIVKGLDGDAASMGAFDITAGRKDLATMLAQAQRMGLRLGVTGAALAAYDAAIADGLGAADAGRIAVFTAGQPK
jgi:3-hydroxyisobutyrate dehydrogenase